MFGSDGMVEECGCVFVERRGVLGGEEADGSLLGDASLHVRVATEIVGQTLRYIFAL